MSSVVGSVSTPRPDVPPVIRTSFARIVATFALRPSGAGRWWALLILGIIGLPASASAQGGSLLVRVLADSVPVNDAVVDLYFFDQLLITVETDAAGEARMAALAAGTFRVEVGALGYRPASSEVRVDVDGQASVVVELEQEAIALEGITVLSDRVRIDVEDTEFSSRFDELAIQMLPLAHDARDLVALTPGARPGHVWGGASFQANSYRIDGLSANHPGLGGDALEPSIHWIEEVSVRGLGAGAEYGGFQGGLIDIVTKRGTDDFQGMLRTTFEDGALNASNLVDTEIGREVASRYDVEGEVRGPLIEGKLHYYLSGLAVKQRQEALNHLPTEEGELAPIAEESTETKLFGKLNWAPATGHEFVLSGAYTGVWADNFDITGYEAPGAATRYSSPTWFLTGSWTGVLGSWGLVEARVNRFSTDQRHDAYAGESTPGLSIFALNPPYTAYLNAPLTLRSNPTSTSGTLETTVRIPVLSTEQEVKFGAEYTRGTFFNERVRNGGQTWHAVRSAEFEPETPATWSRFTWVPSTWGGEVHLDADVTNAAAYAQTALALGPRVVVTPGVRWNRWEGYLTDRSGRRFRAVEDQAVDPRLGVSVDVTGNGTFVLKGHWGRFHQDLISQMFDRAEGADVFTNEEIWYYWGDRFADPSTSFTEAERDALAADGIFRRESVITLNETGPVDGYRQPYIDQWLVAVEKSLGFGAKFEALYTERSNHDMVALVDRNRATNYTRFEDVRVLDAEGRLVPFSGGSVFLEEVYLPNYVLLDRIRCKVNVDCPDDPMIPNMVYADSVNLTWDPDYVLTTAPGARRDFRQFQASLELAQPTWGASISFVLSELKGNLDNVSGYTDPETFGAGPYVRVNEGVNAYGNLENSARKEAKASVWGTLWGRTRVGAFWTYRSGDHYSPQFRVTGLNYNRFRVNTGPAQMGSGGLTLTDYGDELDYRLFYPLTGHRIFVGPRGLPTLKHRANVDLRFEHPFDLLDSEVALSLELFNIFGDESVTELQTMVNNGPDYWYYLQGQRPFNGISANQYYQAPQERVQPRSIRLGMVMYF